MGRRVRLLLIAASVVASVFIASPGRAATAPLIQPGASITMGGSFCTLNWIYDGAGGPYAGTARHCVSAVGQRVSLADGSLGSAVLEFGSVAYISNALDFSLIRIDAGLVDHIDPSLAGHPNIPAGVSTTSSSGIGDLMQFSGHGVGLDLVSVTQEQRVGVLGYNDGNQHYVYGLVLPGDSGGPVADISDGNKAFGIVDTVGLAATPVPQVGEGGVSLTGLLADAAANGFPVSVRTV